MGWIKNKLDTAWKRVAAALAAITAVTGAVVGIVNTCDKIDIAFCSNPPEQSAAIGDLTIDHAATLREFLKMSDLDIGGFPPRDLRTLGVVASVQTTVTGYEGSTVQAKPTLRRAGDNLPLVGQLAYPGRVEPRADKVSRDLAVWIQAPRDPGTHYLVVELKEAGESLAQKQSAHFDWPLPTGGGLTFPVPSQVLPGPLDPRYTSDRSSAPPPVDDSGYWSRITFKYLGLAECEKGGSQYPCFLPLRTAPDFRDEIGRPITKGWPVAGRDWVWVECQANGNGRPNEGLLHNEVGQKSNLWNLVALGGDGDGRKYAWGNDIWFADKGAVEADGTPTFAC